MGVIAIMLHTPKVDFSVKLKNYTIITNFNKSGPISLDVIYLHIIKIKEMLFIN